jgi:beta-lactamase class A
MSQSGGMQTKLTSITAIGATLLLCGNVFAQGDPFKKDKTAPLQPEDTQPSAGETFQDIASRAKPGILGVAVYDFKTGTIQGVNLSRPFSLQSVFKLFASAAVLDQVDAGHRSLDQTITLAPGDIREGVGSVDHSGGGTFSVRDLLRAALIESDNSAGDTLLRLAGGPDKVTAWLRGKGIEGIRLDRYERTFGRDESGKDGFESAKSDPRDTATPEGAIHFLVALKKGDLLSAASTDLLLGWMREAVTGQGRLRAGFSSKTVLAHKTGTSETFEGVSLATNDIGLATLPDGRTLAIVAFLANAPGSDETRDATLAACARLAAKSN